ncbi:MAG: M20/M25/M40 family metallo-hydrolase [Acidobacteriota bacterium]
MMRRIETLAGDFATITAISLRVAVILLIVSGLIAAENKSIETLPCPDEALTGFRSISRNDIRTIVEILASDELEGREAEARGGRLASMFIASWLSAARIPAFGSGGFLNDYFQEIPCISADVDAGSSYISLEKEDGKEMDRKFPLEENAFYSPQSAENFSITAPVVFAGYGIEAPEYDYHDFGSFTMRGKIAIVFNHEPQEQDEKSIFKGAKATRYSMPQMKAQIAREKGAVALVIMRDRNNSHGSMRETLSRRGTKEERGHFLGIEGEPSLIPIFYVEDAVADEIFERSGIDLKEKQAEIDRTLKSEPVDLKGITLTLNVLMKDKKRISLNNVMAKIEGSDILFKDEAVIVAAHYDHLGVKPDGIYHGADDNASGVSALLSLARALHINPVKPKRSIYFVSFAAEEKGVIGSKYLSSHLPVPKEKISVMINMDELGRNNSDREQNADMAIAFMSGQAPELKEIIRKSNEILGMDIKYYPTLTFLTNSDHSLFHDMSIPIVFFFSGFHGDYHKPTDMADKINYPKMERLTRLIYLTIWDIANREGKVKFDRSITKEPEKDEFDKPY